MPIFFIAVLAILLPILLGAVLAFAVYRFDRVVDENQEVIVQGEKQYNPALTLGYKIKTTADPQEQFVEARRLAAAKAAAQPRGANMRIGRKGAENLMTAHDGVNEDPMTAVKIATFHGWDGARTGIPAGGAVQQAATAKAGAAPGKPAIAVPKPTFIEITDEMSPQEVRKARIANAKAKAAYNKALKAAGGDPSATAPAAAPAPVSAPATAPTSAAATAGVPEPDYIEITDDMSADEVRKARIANAKAKSAYNKALKAAGVDPAAAAQPQTAPAAAPAPAAPAPEASLASAAGVPEPDYIEITDDMSADEIRKARISNAKAKSAYNKALKAVGIDPAAVGKAQPAPAATPVPAVESAAPAAPEATTGAAAAAAAGIPEPDYVEITDDMSANEIRQARIANAKAKSAYNKALKAAGIDPASIS